ncbi:MAG: alpha/beta hydrolase, partial [Endomicrobiaceae bacterium]|nr:alpha/beta hydrolase [Endomicrobiaceae bacterium]
VVTLDLAGHGKSGKERTVYSMESFGQDVAAVVKKINAQKVILIGHSMGGYVIIETAKIIPDNVIALVGIDTIQNLEEAYTPEQVVEFVKPFKADFKKTTDSFVRGMFVKGTDPKLVNEIVDMMSNASPAVGVSAMENMFSTSYVTNPPNIKTPVWCLNADLWPTNAEINRKYVTEFNLRLMPGLGHFIMLEKPDEFNKQLDEIIKEILNRSK